ncbi:PREDICTED: G-type lectin S-receptor-like serine/threonine-protein kinase At1g11300 isoform X1 [Lupinus angustifolius]|uniref:G-type lectin S-receptor-like serine/threonine-protein kinase At1g11300 isoform X1 n=1 Tax=Lupinus angustifolius TaxID=3871 RepID=UPI00092FC0C2|nr:PREDICTED: G-type lectin S-receptor-like serine/threonine-protein kinase At1g11300 isoform X1 [Lupinus angustifolius]
MITRNMHTRLSAKMVHTSLVFFWVVLLCLCLDFGAAIDTITSSELVKDPQTISSKNGLFTLGFFSPKNSTNRYVGIWYLSESNILWVANRNQPLKFNSSGTVTISRDGNLVVLNRENKTIWSSNATYIASNSTAQLQDTGNLVLQDSNTGEVIWESFKHPTNVYIPNMKLSRNRITGEEVSFTSWKNSSDPSVGYFSCSLERLSAPELFLWVNGTLPYYRSGPWNGEIFIGFRPLTTGYLKGCNVSDEDDGTVYFSCDSTDQYDFRTVALSPEGLFETASWKNKKKISSDVFHGTNCNQYGVCGAFGSCDWQTSPVCSCLSGYQAKNVEEWNRKNWTSGCVRKVPLQCGSEVRKDGFLKLEKMKVPDYLQKSASLENECSAQCLQNCSCVAYAYDTGIGCMSWFGDLIDTQKFSDGGLDLYIRMPPSELDKHSGKRRVIIAAAVSTIGVTTLAICVYLLWKWSAKPTAARKRKRDVIFWFNRGESTAVDRTGKKIGEQSQVELHEQLLFDTETLALATNNFDSSNKLGQGGFGPVYKGKLKDGREIAVKRLSKASGQGLEEFMNEVVVISKLQHRNLVRLLGCCREGEEKMLIYEYMLNKSLDTFIFGPSEHKLLDWGKRFSIIEGIARGLLYLHRDSRLRIIHRDLKASNILLDEELNPKISDFGLAKIFGGRGDEASTSRVVGTYGYMAPEYAMEGIVSEKSDVFSFGVLVLEIVSGRKNTSFYNNEQFRSLVRFVWKLWNEDNIISAIDQSICDPMHEKDIVRCVHIGLLCVQEGARHRPNMATVISMLNSEIVNLPPPKQPAFIEKPDICKSLSSEERHASHSNNIVSITDIKGR